MDVEGGGYRVGDPEREAALAQLREHAAQGRLDAAEFDARVGAVLQARTRADLAQQFTDLPPLDDELPRPAGSTVALTPAATAEGLATPQDTTTTPVPSSRDGWSWRTGLSAAVWPATLVACVATGWSHWWLMLVPMVVSAFLTGGQDDDDDEDDEEPEQPARSGTARR